MILYIFLKSKEHDFKHFKQSRDVFVIVFIWKKPV